MVGTKMEFSSPFFFRPSHCFDVFYFKSKQPLSCLFDGGWLQRTISILSFMWGRLLTPNPAHVSFQISLFSSHSLLNFFMFYKRESATSFFQSLKFILMSTSIYWHVREVGIRRGGSSTRELNPRMVHQVHNNYSKSQIFNKSWSLWWIENCGKG